MDGPPAAAAACLAQRPAKRQLGCRLTAPPARRHWQCEPSESGSGGSGSSGGSGGSSCSGTQVGGCGLHRAALPLALPAGAGRSAELCAMPCWRRRACGSCAAASTPPRRQTPPTAPSAAPATPTAARPTSGTGRQGPLQRAAASAPGPFEALPRCRTAPAAAAAAAAERRLTHQRTCRCSASPAAAAAAAPAAAPGAAAAPAAAPGAAAAPAAAPR